MSQVYIFPPGYASATVPAGGATAANQVLEIAELTSIDNKTPTFGQKTMANSSPVVIASDQSPVAVTVSSSPLPTGAATSANQVTELSRLSGSLVPTAFDETDLTYIVAGNGAGQIGTAVYKLASLTVKTLTLTYDSSNRLSNVVAS